MKELTGIFVGLGIITVGLGGYEIYKLITKPRTQMTITSINPSSGVPGMSYTLVKVIGNSFSGSSLTASLGDGITIDRAVIVSDTEIDLSITILATAVPGARTVSVTVDGNTASLSDAFTVLEVSETSQFRNLSVSSFDPPQGSQLTVGSQFGGTIKIDHRGAAIDVYMGLGVADSKAIGHNAPFVFNYYSVGFPPESDWTTHEIDILKSIPIPTGTLTGSKDVQVFISKAIPTVGQVAPDDFALNGWDDNIWAVVSGQILYPLTLDHSYIVYSLDKTTWKTYSPDSEAAPIVPVGTKVYIVPGIHNSAAQQESGLLSISGQWNVANVAFESNPYTYLANMSQWATIMSYTVSGTGGCLTTLGITCNGAVNDTWDIWLPGAQ